MVLGDVGIVRKANNYGREAVEFDNLSFLQFHTQAKS